MPIKAIDSDAVHRINSNQVITELQIAVKELLENSLDAGATAIEIKFKEFGLESVQVIDNGTGIEASDWTALARKHETSKLSTFHDLESVTSFGFRGEALSSLCAISGSVEILTRDASQSTATRLRFDAAGNLLDGKEKMARAQGTTVTVQDLFGRLVVRQKEFQKHHKREFTKAVQLITAYALVPAIVLEGESRFVKLSVTNVTNGKRSVHLQTTGTDARKAVASIYGPKAVDTLLDVGTFFMVGEYSVQLTGLLSSSLYGMGRTSNDRQFIYFNARPIQHPKISKLLNATYQAYNHHQYPLAVLNFQLPTQAYDVNLTPDKRTIFVQNETQFLEGLRVVLEAFFGSIEHSFPATNPSHARTQSAPLLSPMSESPTPSVNSDHLDSEDLDTSRKQDFQFLPEVDAEESAPKPRPKQVQMVMSDFMAGSDDAKRRRIGCKPETVERKLGHGEDDSMVQTTLNLNNTFDEDMTQDTPDALPSTQQIDMEMAELNSTPISRSWNEHRVQSSPAAILSTVSRSKHVKSDMRTVFCPEDMDEPVVANTIEQNITPRIDDNVWQVDMHGIGTRLVEQVSMDIDQAVNIDNMAEGASINESDATAQAVLSQIFDKSDFKSMAVVGQFNLGFIIARREKVKDGVKQDDLFIIDQHASDEKYNYERLRRDTKIECQTLLQPKILDLSATYELVAQTHQASLAKSGFEVVFDETAGMNQRLKLLTTPISKDTKFDTSDLEELLHLLQDVSISAATSVRCTKANRMFASRACRKSIMIGKALKPQQMREVLEHLSTLDQPWNCPHGRPTMRHLYNIPSMTRPTPLLDDICWTKFM